MVNKDMREENKGKEALLYKRYVQGRYILCVYKVTQKKGKEKMQKRHMDMPKWECCKVFAVRMVLKLRNQIHRFMQLLNE